MKHRARPAAPPVERLALGERQHVVLTDHEAAALLQVRPRELVRFIRTRGLPAVHLGRKLGWRLTEADVWRWLEAQKNGGAP